MKVKVIIPVFNESGSIGHVLTDIPRDIVNEVIVVNNGSTDDSPEIAASAGATVLSEPVKGYGGACLKGLRYLESLPVDQQPDIVVFMDGDYSDYPEETAVLIEPIVAGKADMVIGSRALGQREKGSMMPQQIFGNWLATTLMRWFFGARYTDLGPFRAITWSGLQKLEMQDTNYGWTVEMQIKAVKRGLRYTELPVSYRKRIGKSKITGTVKGTVMAGYKIIGTIIKYA
ncbi:MAG: glycosyltransferase family 2 protein [Chitinophagales bacterium]|nr:glycosyltransferase family 2 protein [Chitinophagales bacterium]HAE14098.1 UDP-glucose--dolichyl-phosphate glucosyltransferase [Bacteroidota bacterium]MCB9019808.1 glycosyltransferase family 2 protein [Chitinophagales bacterium]MCB9021417.1 glycosyltransferase family 2 protein [Chitinophagales bacterium]MCB9031628.1 glycosyltransferase family 2 protein [Chitinophagales bacterium]